MGELRVTQPRLGTHQANDPIKLTKPSRLDAPAQEIAEHPSTVAARNKFFCHLTWGE